MSSRHTSHQSPTDLLKLQLNHPTVLLQPNHLTNLLQLNHPTVLLQLSQPTVLLQLSQPTKHQKLPKPTTPLYSIPPTSHQALQAPMSLPTSPLRSPWTPSPPTDRPLSWKPTQKSNLIELNRNLHITHQPNHRALRFPANRSSP